MYITSKNFVKTTFFLVIFRLAWIGEGTRFRYAVYSLEYLRNKKCLRGEVLSFFIDNITFNLFTGKSLLKQAKYLAHPNKDLTSWSIKKFINIALPASIVFKVIKSITFSRTFDKNKPNITNVKRKNGHVHPKNLLHYS